MTFGINKLIDSERFIKKLEVHLLAGCEGNVYIRTKISNGFLALIDWSGLLRPPDGEYSEATSRIVKKEGHVLSAKPAKDTREAACYSSVAFATTWHSQVLLVRLVQQLI